MWARNSDWTSNKKNIKPQPNITSSYKKKRVYNALNRVSVLHRIYAFF